MKMTEEKNTFYFQGKYFDNEEDFWNYSKKWRFLPLDQETADRNLNTLKKEIIMNIFLRGIEMDNMQFSALLNRIFEFVINDLDRFYVPKRNEDG